MSFFNPATREKKQLLPGINARTFWGEKMLAAVIDLDPHTELPQHSHPHEQIGVLLEGQLQLTIDGETRLLEPQDVYVIPGDIPHSAKTFTRPVRVLDIFSPVREEYKY